MSDEKAMLQLQAATVATLDRIARALETIALSKAPAPNFVRKIGEFSGFDFDSIGAKIVAHDQHGPTALEWGGYQWTRRSPSNKFGSAIWFSRPIGKDETGVRYARLITFREQNEAEPLPGKIVEKVATVPKPVKPEQVHAPLEDDVAQAPQLKPAPTAGNGQKLARITSGAWFDRAKRLASRTPYYQKDGEPDLYHLAASALKCGYSEITDSNLDAVLEALKVHAQEQTIEVPEASA